jgi:hypothetical protein
MKNLFYALLLMFMFTVQVNSQGTWWHDDGYNDPNIPDDLEAAIHDNHSMERCTNYPINGETAKKSCDNSHSSSPRENHVGCDLLRDGGTRICDVEATVYCPGLGPSNKNGWLTFIDSCSISWTVPGNNWPTAGAGYIGQTSWGATQRGVVCGSRSCGCIPAHPNGTPTTFFGNPVHDGDGVYYCQ